MRNDCPKQFHRALQSFVLLFCAGLLAAAHGDQDDGGAVTVVAGNGQPGFADGTGEAARFNKPIRLAPFGKGRIVVADISNHAIRILTREGRVTTISGRPNRKGIQDGPAGEALFNSPHAVAWDDAGGILVVDIGNASVRRIKDGIVTTVVQPGEGGMAMPIDMSLTAGGDVLVADAASNTVLRKPVGGPLETVAMSGTIAVPHGVASDAAGNVYAAEIRGHRVSKISPVGELSVVAGTGEAGIGQDQLNKPAAVLLHDGLLWIADLGNHRIMTVPLAP